MQVASPLGIIWAGLVIASGMVASLGLEAVGGLWMLLISLAALRCGAVNFQRP